MAPDKRPLPPAVEEGAQQIRAALKRELSKQSHRRTEIAAEVGRSESSLYKSIGGRSEMRLTQLLHTTHAMGLDARAFLADSLGARASAEALLESLEGLGPIDSGADKLEKAIRVLERTSPGPPPAREGDAEALVAEVTACNGREQRRRIKTAEKYRFAGFVDAYLEHLDALRYDKPKVVASCAVAAVRLLIPRLGGTQAERIALAAKAIGVFGSAHRGAGNTATAARAARLALDLARRHGLRSTTARLLQRGSCVLSDYGEFKKASKLLNEALLIYVDLDDQLGFGMVVVDRGIMSYHLGEYRDAIRSLNRGLAIVEAQPKHLAQTRVSAYQVIGLSYEELGILDLAEEAYAKAVEAFGGRSESNWAKLTWLRARIALKRECFAVAEDLLRRSWAVLDRKPDPDAAGACSDLIKVLLAQAKTADAIDVTKSMARYLDLFRASRIVVGTISGCIQAALAGVLSLQHVEDLQKKLHEHHSGISALNRAPSKNWTL